MTVTALYEVPLGVCTQDPDRWTTTPDDEAKTLCRACPRRWLCARDAVESAGAEGLWAGVVIPESGRARAFALGQPTNIVPYRLAPWTDCWLSRRPF